MGAVSDLFEKLNVAIRLEVIEKAALLGTAGLLRKVLAILGLKCKDSFGPLRICCCLLPRVIYQAT